MLYSDHSKSELGYRDVKLLLQSAQPHDAYPSNVPQFQQSVCWFHLMPLAHGSEAVGKVWIPQLRHSSRDLADHVP